MVHGGVISHFSRVTCNRFQLILLLSFFFQKHVMENDKIATAILKSPALGVLTALDIKCAKTRGEKEKKSVARQSETPHPLFLLV